MSSIQHLCDENIENQPALKKQKTAAGTEAKAIARFVVSSIRSKGRSAASNYTVDVLVAKHSLYELVSIIIDDIMNKREEVTEDCVYSHIWSLQFKGTPYRYFGTDSTIDARSPVPLSSIDLKKGDKGSFQGETGTFDFEVKSLEKGKTKDDDSPAYPCIKPVPNTISSILSSRRPWSIGDAKERQNLNCATQLVAIILWQCIKRWDLTAKELVSVAMGSIRTMHESS